MESHCSYLISLDLAKSHFVKAFEVQDLAEMKGSDLRA